MELVTQRAVRKGRWKLIENGMLAGGADTRLTADDTLFLVDLEQDPGETRNLRKAQPEVVREFVDLLRKWEKDVIRR